MNSLQQTILRQFAEIAPDCVLRNAHGVTDLFRDNLSIPLQKSENLLFAMNSQQSALFTILLDIARNCTII